MKITESQLRRLIRSRLLVEREERESTRKERDQSEEDRDTPSGRPSGEYADASTLEISPDGLDNIKREEGSVSQVYDDETGKVIDRWDQLRGNPTIGVGHLLYRIEDKDEPHAVTARESGDWEDDKWGSYLGPGSSLNNEEIRRLLADDIESHTRWKEDITKPITQNMFDSIADFAFNAGNGAPAEKFLS
jgi:GH24 family phage-related lysozyme (muramidase)